MRDMKATQSEWCNQRQGDSICQEISARKDNDIQGNGKYLTKVQCYEMPATINVRYLTANCKLQSKIHLGTLPTKDMSYSVSECQVCTVPKDVIYMKLSCIEMLYT